MTAPSGPIGEHQPLDAAALLGALLRHWRRALAAFLATLLVGAALAFATPPVFVAEALLRIERPAPVAGGLDRSEAPSDVGPPAAAMTLLGDEAFFETEVGLVRSRTLARRVAADLQLAMDDRFRQQMGAGQTPIGPDLAERRGRAVIRILGERLRVAAVRGARLATIRFSAPSPGLAAKIANAFANGAIAAEAERRLAASGRAADFMDAQLADARERLSASEQALADYARRRGIASLPSGPGADAPGAAPSLTAATLESLNGALAQAQAERIAAEARWRQARAAGLAGPDVQASLAVQQMVQDRAKLAAEYRDQLAVFKPAYPRVKPLRARLDEADRQLAAEVAAIVESLESRYRAALTAEQGLRQRVHALTADLSGLRQRSIGYATLQREAESRRLAFDALARRSGALRVAAAEIPVDLTLVDPATSPDRPSWPRPALIMALAAVAGLALAVTLALAADGWLAPRQRDD